MFLLLPLVGGAIASWLAPKRTAMAIQLAFAIVAATVVIASAPSHGADYGIAVFVVPITLVVAVVGFGLGLLVRRRRLVP